MGGNSNDNSSSSTVGQDGEVASSHISSSGTTSYMGTFNVDPRVTQDTISTERSEQLKLRNVHNNVHFRDSVSNSEPQTSSGHSSKGEGNLIDDSIGSERQIIDKEEEEEGEG